MRVWGTAFRVSGLGVEAPSGASAGEASVGVGADRVVVAVVRVVGTLVVITPETITFPPAPRTESTVSREAFISDSAALKRWGGGGVLSLRAAGSIRRHRKGQGSGWTTRLRLLVGFRVSGLGFNAPSGAGAGEAGVGVGANRVRVAVVHVERTTVPADAVGEQRRFRVRGGGHRADVSQLR